jgi:hypothetical protein
MPFRKKKLIPSKEFLVKELLRIYEDLHVIAVNKLESLKQLEQLERFELLVEHIGVEQIVKHMGVERFLEHTSIEKIVIEQLFVNEFKILKYTVEQRYWQISRAEESDNLSVKIFPKILKQNKQNKDIPEKQIPILHLIISQCSYLILNEECRAYLIDLKVG